MNQPTDDSTKGSRTSSTPRPNRTTPTGTRSRLCSSSSAAAPRRAPGGNHALASRSERGEGEWQVDQERGTPPELVSEQCDEGPAEHRADRHGQPDRRSHQSEGPPTRWALEVLLDEADHLRIEQTGPQAHEDAGD